VILEKDYREENGEYQEEGSDRQDDREKTQAYELEVIVTIQYSVCSEFWHQTFEYCSLASIMRLSCYH